MYLNKALIYGNMTRDPELRSLPSGVKVATFGVATNRVYKDQDGNKKEQSDFHNVVVFARQAEIVSQYLKKGSGVFVEGRMQTRSWEGQDGQKKYRTEIVADRVQFGPRGGGSPSAGGQDQAQQNNNASGDNQDTGKGDEGIQYPDEEINPDDIPF
ncbi:MAG: single-stranded DNA-binding protein [Parcubacteria group bacterium CG11_big_fil_rev_8_21_14_0_20_39_22]|nr:MAG: single-stranded DNA-binding protein [Parcubacteria group bacterium CG11_big_fil_rev_8_21_14_0_20_39_22]